MKKNMLKFILILVLGFVLPNLIGCNESDQIDKVNNNDNQYVIENPQDIVITHELSYVLYQAAKTTLTNHNQRSIRKVNNTNTTDQVNHIEYPFDLIRITNPFTFTIEIPSGSNTYVESKVGSGVIEVIICQVDFLIDNNGNVEGFVTEDCIIFKGDLGITSCLTNGASMNYETNTFEYEFSTHKFFNDNEIVKDFNDDNTLIYVAVNLDQPINVEQNRVGLPLSVIFDSWESFNKYANGSYTPIEGSYKTVEATDLYSLDQFINIQK